MVKPLRRSARVGLLLALFLGLLGNGQCQMAMEIWADIQAQLDSHQEQLDSQQDQICTLYEDSELPFPPECIMPPECPAADPLCGGGGPCGGEGQPPCPPPPGPG